MEETTQSQTITPEFAPINSNKLPLINSEKQKLSRRFLGNIFGIGKDKNEFKAYLQGATYFYYKSEKQVVRQEYFYS